MELSGFRSGTPHAATPLIDLSGIRDMFIRGAWAPRNTPVFLHLRGASSAGIVLRDNVLESVEKPVTFAEGATPSIVR